MHEACKTSNQFTLAHHTLTLSIVPVYLRLRYLQAVRARRDDRGDSPQEVPDSAGSIHVRCRAVSPFLTHRPPSAPMRPEATAVHPKPPAVSHAGAQRSTRAATLCTGQPLGYGASRWVSSSAVMDAAGCPDWPCCINSGERARLWAADRPRRLQAACRLQSDPANDPPLRAARVVASDSEKAPGPRLAETCDSGAEGETERIHRGRGYSRPAGAGLVAVRARAA
jgi:hypothetical protein